LLISGYIVDRPSIIVESTPYAPLGNSDNKPKPQSWFKRALDWQIMCYLLAESVSSRLTRNEFLDTFCRTMAFNALPNRCATPGEEYTAGFKALHSKLKNRTRETVKYSLALPILNTPANQHIIYESVCQELSAGRKFAVTSKGDLTWVPSTTNLGDRVCFLAGCSVPFVIRPIGKAFELLGDCYLHSMMSNGSIALDFKPQLFEFQ
jgi:hypothetical protein